MITEDIQRKIVCIMLIELLQDSTIKGLSLRLSGKVCGSLLLDTINC